MTDRQRRDTDDDRDKIEDVSLPPITPGPEPDTSDAAQAEKSDESLDED